MMENQWNRDCKEFNGIYSCEIMTAEGYKDCSECGFYERIGKKILILKLGAMGDVVRTTSLLAGLKKEYGRDSHITWVVEENSKEILYNNPDIDRILPYNPETALLLSQEKFDVLLSLEISPPITLAANIIKADEKYGYHLDEDGHPSPFNESAVEYLETAFSNKLNKGCRKTYQRMMFEISELEYNKEDYVLNLEGWEGDYGEKIVTNKNKKVVGINVGSAGRWPSKAWHSSKIIELIRKLRDYNVILLGGRRETELIKEIEEGLGSVKVMKNDTKNSVREFIGVLNNCDVIITGDSLALHLALGLKKNTVALFFCTPDWQVEDYDYLRKVKSPLLEKYFMDDRYIEELVSSISSNEVLEAVKSFSG